MELDEECLKKAFAEIFKNGTSTRDEFKKEINKAIRDCDTDGRN